MMAFVVLINLIFWGSVLYWLYKRTVEPTVKKYRDASEGVEIARKFGGVEKIYDKQVSFFKESGFRIVSSSNKIIELEKKEESTVSEIKMEPSSTEEAAVKFSSTHIDGESIEFELNADRRDKDLQKLYKSLCKEYLYKYADKNRSNNWGTKKDFIIEESLSRKKIYSLRWDNIANKIRRDNGRASKFKIRVI